MQFMQVEMSREWSYLAVDLYNPLPDELEIKFNSSATILEFSKPSSEKSFIKDLSSNQITGCGTEPIMAKQTTQRKHTEKLQ